MIQKLDISQELEKALRDETRSHQHASREIRVRSSWPGIQLYYPPIKYLPRDERYETEDEARERLLKYAKQALPSFKPNAKVDPDSPEMFKWYRLTDKEC